MSRYGLHVKLSVIFLALLVGLGLIGAFVFWQATRLHGMETQQQLNRDLARQIATAKHDLLLESDGTIREEGLAELFHWLMVVNPNVEFYVLDREGTIVGYDAPPGVVKRDRVDLEPVRALLGGEASLPILGEDPRDVAGRKVFSVSPLPASGEPQGYLYIILASEQWDTVAEVLGRSYALRIGTWGVLGAFALTALVGLVVFHRLTRPLRGLAARMGSDEAGSAARGDEVALLERTFERMTLRIQDQMDQIRRTEEMRRELVANVSHDLRTPLASLQGYLDTLLMKAGEADEAERERYLRIAVTQAERLGRLVDELFELSKLEAGIVEPVFESFPIDELVSDNVLRHRVRATEQKVELEARVEARTPFVKADIGMIERVLDNLIANALQHTGEGGRVEVRLRPKGGEVEVEVADTGDGIPADLLPHIFDRFVRKAEGGAGLGLAIAQKVLELHGGRIEVDSELGVGSAFRFRLPVQAA